MAAQPFRPFVPDPREPVIHELEPVRFAGQTIPLRVVIRRAEDGGWRGRLRFGDPEAGAERETVEIFRAATEADLWHAVHGLRAHHLHALFRSLV